jgi:radical SAM superfamily enzyme YgiQ (UPF0313 family)
VSSYERHLIELQKRERGLRAAGGGGLKAAVIYPNRYAVGMSNLGFLSVFRRTAEQFGVSAERAFLPDPPYETGLRRAGNPVLTLESRRGLREMDLLLFSVSFENDYLNLLKILDLSRIPLRSRARDKGHPLVGAGGAAVQINPETISPFVDFFALGEGEELVPDILTVFRELGGARGDKREILDALSQIEGVYVPERFEAAYDGRGRLTSFVNVSGGRGRVTVRKRADLSGMALCSPIVTGEAEFSDMLLVEIERGCPFGCAFCVASALYAPVRMRPEEDIISDIESGMVLTRTVGLLGPAVSSHPGLIRVLDTIRQHGGSVGLPSIRTELLTDEGIGLLSGLSIRSLTIAPEAGSERLRRSIGKSISDGEIFGLVRRAASAGIMSVRAYFLVGMPGEDDDDIKAISELAKKIRHTLIAATRSAGKTGRVTVSLTPLVPKPHTPLQWMAMEDRKALSGKITRIQGALKGVGGLSVIFEPPKWSYLQALIARGDRRVADILERAATGDGDLNAVFRETPVNPDFYVTRPRDDDELFPWDFIDLGVDKKKMLGRYKTIIGKGRAG